MLNRAARKLLPQGPHERGELAKRDRRLPHASSSPANAGDAQSDAFPMRPERILADVREVLPRDAIITTDVGWNKNGVGQQFPIYTPGIDPHAGRLRDDGLRRAGGDRRQARAARRWSSRWSATAASARTRRCSRPRSS